MCSLMEHSERSYRERQTASREPLYAAAAAEHGIPYEPPPVDSSESSEND